MMDARGAGAQAAPRSALRVEGARADAQGTRRVHRGVVRARLELAEGCALVAHGVSLQAMPPAAARDAAFPKVAELPAAPGSRTRCWTVSPRGGGCYEVTLFAIVEGPGGRASLVASWIQVE